MFKYNTKECTYCFEPDFARAQMRESVLLHRREPAFVFPSLYMDSFFSCTKMLHLHVILNAPVNLQPRDAALRQTHALHVFIHNDK